MTVLLNSEILDKCNINWGKGVLYFVMQYKNEIKLIKEASNSEINEWKLLRPSIPCQIIQWVTHV